MKRFHSITRLLVVGAVVLAVNTACSGSGVAEGPCDDMCRELVQSCEYAAFPDLQSCLDGCNFEASEGADVAGQAQCVADAMCDTFLVVECQQTYGLAD
jgi:hypothetical protein